MTRWCPTPSWTRDQSSVLSAELPVSHFRFLIYKMRLSCFTWMAAVACFSGWSVACPISLILYGQAESGKVRKEPIDAHSGNQIWVPWCIAKYATHYATTSHHIANNFLFTRCAERNWWCRGELWGGDSPGWRISYRARGPDLTCQSRERRRGHPW